MIKLTKLMVIAAIAVISAAIFTSCGDDSGNPAQYTVTVTDDGNGTAVADKAKATAGTTITLTATPAEGYVFSKWTVKGADITLLPNATTSPATFTMPEGDVSIKAEFVVYANPGASTETTAEFDNSNFGLYKGIIAGSSGTIKIEINNGNGEAKATIAIDGGTEELTGPTSLANGQAITNAAFTGATSSFTFSVDADGKNPVINNIVIEGHDNVAVSVIKETSANVAYCYEGTAIGGNDHTGVLNIVRNGNTYSGVQKTTGPEDNYNNGLTYPLKGSIDSDGSFSGVVTVKGKANNPDYIPGDTLSQDIIEIDISMTYSGSFRGDTVRGTWSVSFLDLTNTGTFVGGKTL